MRRKAQRKLDYPFCVLNSVFIPTNPVVLHNLITCQFN
jgi:hypothetical protein